MKTLVEFADDALLNTLIIKERVKCSRKYAQRVRKQAEKRKQGGSAPQVSATPQQQSNLDLLTSMLPSRNDWVRPKKRKKFRMENGKTDHRKLNSTAIRLTLKHVREAHPEDDVEFLKELKSFRDDIRRSLADSGCLKFHKPLLNKTFKKKDEETGTVIYRPLAVYADLRDKIILAVTSRYLMKNLNGFLHDDILSYRSARKYHSNQYRITDFNDGILQIRKFRKLHLGEPVYVADCDIKKFYDTINHEVVRDCFRRMLPALGLSQEGCAQVLNILNAYLDSYNFYENVKLVSERPDFWKQEIRKRHAQDLGEKYQFEWISDREFAECYGSQEAFEQQRTQIGVPQGGALSLMIANVVLNDVDRQLVDPRPFPEGDSNKLFLRFCDDMSLMHTDQQECERLIQAYCQSLTEHKLIYHPFTQVSEVKNEQQTSSDFWHVKSHSTFLWGKGTGNASEWIGFLGYEMNADGEVRLRKSNLEKFTLKLDRQRIITLRQLHNLHDRMKQSRKRGEAIDLYAEVQDLMDSFNRSMSQIVGGLKFYKGLDSTSEPLRRQLAWLDGKRESLLRELITKSEPILQGYRKENPFLQYLENNQDTFLPEE